MKIVRRKINELSMWELAYYISVRLNDILELRSAFFTAVTPEDILKKSGSRSELEFFYSKICLNVLS